MSIDRIVLAFAGFMILASLLLGVYVSPNPLALILKRLGVQRGAAF